VWCFDEKSPETLTAVLFPCLPLPSCASSLVGPRVLVFKCRSVLGDRSPPRGGGGGDGERFTGIALRWNEKGFGFIKPDDGGDDLFCHFSGIQDGRCLIEGSKVSYRKSYDDRKQKDRAEEVTGGAPEDPGMEIRMYSVRMYCNTDQDPA